jgi:hypothetical protein
VTRKYAYLMYYVVDDLADEIVILRPTGSARGVGGIIPERWAASSGFRRPTGLLRPAGLFLGFTAPSVKITGEMHVFPRPRQRAGYSTPCALDAAQTVKFRGGELFFVFNVSSARSRRLWAGTARQRESK